jgi:hypothetical protein
MRERGGQASLVVQEQTDDEADPAAEHQEPSQQGKNRREITRVADVTMETGRDEVVLLLGRPGGPEALFQRIHRPDSQHAAGGVDYQSQVSDRVAVKHHEVATVGIRRKE